MEIGGRETGTVKEEKRGLPCLKMEALGASGTFSVVQPQALLQDLGRVGGYKRGFFAF